MEYQHVQSRPNLKLNGSAGFVADSSIAIAIQYRGTQPSATVTVSSGDITLKHGTAAAETVDNTVGASGVVADGTYTTLGAMVDAINASPNWHAEIVDGLRSDVSTAALKTLSETTLSPVRTQVLGLYFDTSAFLSLSYRISARRTNFNRKQDGRQSVLKMVKTLVNIGSGTLTFTVYDVDKTSGTAVTLYTETAVDNTELVAPFTSQVGEGSFRSEVGHDLLVRITGSVDCPDSGAYLRVNGEIV